MAKASQNLVSMSVDALLKLRDQIGVVLGRKSHDLQRQLSRLSSDPFANGRKNGRSSLKGRKVAPKYRDPKTGQTWAARGAQPVWLRNAIKDGAKIEEFAIAHAAKPSRKSGRKKTRK